MVAAVITASASVIVAVLVFVLNQYGQLRFERRQARLARVNAQLRDLYGPLQALVATNEKIWTALREAHLPDAALRRSDLDLAKRDADDWRRWMAKVLMPINRQMRDLVIQHADLLIEDEVPEPLQAFCAHVSAYEVIVEVEDELDGRPEPLIDHPGKAYVTYVFDSFHALKAEQALLLSRRRWGLPRSSR